MKKFNKEERLCSRKYLDLLFKNGSSFLLYPFRVSYLIVDQQAAFPVQVVINVPKRRFKHAVDRNFLKRRIREAYRLHKQENLYNVMPVSGKLVLLSLQFVGKQQYEFSFIEKKLLAALRKLLTSLNDDQSS